MKGDGWKTWLKRLKEQQRVGRKRPIQHNNNKQWKTDDGSSKLSKGEVIKDKKTRMERWKKHFSHVTNRDTPENPINEYEEMDNEDIEVDTGEITLRSDKAK